MHLDLGMKWLLYRMYLKPFRGYAASFPSKCMSLSSSVGPGPTLIDFIDAKCALLVLPTALMAAWCLEEVDWPARLDIMSREQSGKALLTFTGAIGIRIAGQGALHLSQALLKFGLPFFLLGTNGLGLHKAAADRAVKVFDSGVKLGLEVSQDNRHESIRSHRCFVEGGHHGVMLEKGRRLDQLLFAMLARTVAGRVEFADEHAGRGH